MKAASFIKIAFFINKSKRDLRVKVCCATELRAERWYAVPKGGGDGASRQTIDDRRGRDLRFEI